MTKVKKHRKWLADRKFHIASYGDRILFINDCMVFDRLETCFYIDVKEKKVYSHFMGAKLYFYDYRINIDLYCFHKYGFKPTWEHKGTEDFQRVLFKIDPLFLKRNLELQEKYK